MGRIRVGNPQVRVDLPSHTPGVAQGNSTNAYDSEVGHFKDGTSSSRRSTGIYAKTKNPIVAGMPNLSPP